MTCRCGFISCNKCVSLVCDVDSGGACGGAGSVWEFSVLSVQFCCELETVLKIKVLFKKCFSLAEEIRCRCALHTQGRQILNVC